MTAVRSAGTLLGRGLLALALVATLGTAACHHHREGPAERAGEKIDRAADRAGDQVERAGRKINKALPGD